MTGDWEPTSQTVSPNDPTDYVTFLDRWLATGFAHVEGIEPLNGC